MQGEQLPCLAIGPLDRIESRLAPTLAGKKQAKLSCNAKYTSSYRVT